MSYYTCDDCAEDNYTEANPFVEIRVPRPSDPSDLCCIMGGHSNCFPGNKTPAQWDDYIESAEAMRNGHMFLT